MEGSSAGKATTQLYTTLTYSVLHSLGETLEIEGGKKHTAFRNNRRTAQCHLRNIIIQKTVKLSSFTLLSFFPPLPLYKREGSFGNSPFIYPMRGYSQVWAITVSSGVWLFRKLCRVLHFFLWVNPFDVFYVSMARKEIKYRNFMLLLFIFA